MNEHGLCVPKRNDWSKIREINLPSHGHHQNPCICHQPVPLVRNHLKMSKVWPQKSQASQISTPPNIPQSTPELDHVLRWCQWLVWLIRSRRKPWGFIEPQLFTRLRSKKVENSTWSTFLLRTHIDSSIMCKCIYIYIHDTPVSNHQILLFHEFSEAS